MTTASLIQSVVRRPTGDGLGLIIEQAPYPKGTGRVSRLAIVRAMAARLYGLEQPEVDCGMDGVNFSTAVWVYPYEPGLVYAAGVTNGVLSPAVRSEVTIRETVSFSLTDQATLEYPMQEFVSSAWLSDEIWSGDGAVITIPPPAVDGQNVSAGQKVYGTALVTYKTVRFIHSVTVSPREDAVENVYQSVFWAAWNGGVKLHEIKTPEGAEEDYQFQIECSGGYNVDINPDDDDDDRPPSAPKADREIKIDYCEFF